MTHLHAAALGFIALSSQVFAETEVDFSAHGNIVAGSSEIDEILLGKHAHDPSDEFSLQSLELSTAINFNERFGLKASYNVFLDEEDKIDGEWEDAYFTINQLPLNLSLRAGRIFNETSSENNTHLHSWKFTNASLLTSRFMGEEGLLTESVEMQWKLPFEHQSHLSLSYGNAVAHEHGEEEEMAAPTDIHGEESNLTDSIFTIATTGLYLHTDFHQFNYRVHFSKGTNGYGLDGNVYGANLGYQWRENGQETGGKEFSVQSEWIQRRFNYASEDSSIQGKTSEQGLSLRASYNFGNQWELGLRHEHLQGSNILEETPETTRNSIALTRYFTLSDQLDGHVRLQYDQLKQEELEDSHTAWLQFQINFGAAH